MVPEGRCAIQILTPDAKSMLGSEMNALLSIPVEHGDTDASRYWVVLSTSVKQYLQQRQFFYCWLCRCLATTSERHAIVIPRSQKTPWQPLCQHSTQFFFCQLSSVMAMSYSTTLVSGNGSCVLQMQVLAQL